MSRYKVQLVPGGVIPQDLNLALRLQPIPAPADAVPCPDCPECPPNDCEPLGTGWEVDNGFGLQSIGYGSGAIQMPTPAPFSTELILDRFGLLSPCPGTNCDKNVCWLVSFGGAEPAGHEADFSVTGTGGPGPWFFVADGATGPYVDFDVTLQAYLCDCTDIVGNQLPFGPPITFTC